MLKKRTYPESSVHTLGLITYNGLIVCALIVDNYTREKN